MNKSFVECITVSKKYSNNGYAIDAVSDLTLHVENGEFLLIRGQSGAGKSTLLNLIGGLIEPSSGRIRIGDDIINELSNKSLSELLVNKIGIIFQGFNLLPSYNVFENIEVALQPKRMRQEEIRNVIVSYLEQFGLADKIYQFPSELSLGQQQRVAIIRTLAKKPSLILADEPTGSLDSENASAILDHLRLLNREKGATVVLATHGSVPEDIADRVVFMEKGSIAAKKSSL